MITTDETIRTQQQGECEVCEKITDQYDEWSGRFFCSDACAQSFFAAYMDAVAGMLSDEADEEEGES